MRHCDTYQIPAYAVPYIANDDPTGLSDLEIELIDGFMASTFPRGCSVDWGTCQQPHFSLSILATGPTSGILTRFPVWRFRRDMDLHRILGGK